MTNEKRVEVLLEQADELLLKDLDAEKEHFKKNSWASVKDTEKYEQAEKLFKKVLELDPDNRKAKDGLRVCDTMLTPYAPVQYMVPATAFDGEIPVSVEPTTATVTSPPPKDDRMPWEVLEDRRARDRQGLEYTAKVASEAGKDAKAEAESMIAAARKKVEENKVADREAVFKEFSDQLRELQERVHRQFKGHGPEFLDQALTELRNTLFPSA